MPASPRIRPGEALGVGFEGTTLPADVVALAETSGLAAVILFARNCPSLDTVLALTAAGRALGPDVLVLVDHEGGRVHRLPPPFTRFPPAAAVGRAKDPALAGAVARAMARELRAAGFDSGLTPVLDCLTDPGNTVIGDRAFAADPETVAACGVAFITAALEEGLIPVAKHFPGHGRTAVDSHLALPQIDAPAAMVEQVELLPFRRAIAAGCLGVMVAHIRYPALDADWPASLSHAVIGGLLRGRLGFTGLVVSDDLEMQAVAQTWGVGAAAVRFVEAGGDLALVCRDATSRGEALGALEAALAAGRLSLDAARRRRAALRALASARPTPDVGVIGCAEHRELAAEVARRGGA
ncbi:MAG TPA: beta-N-acetylhexosaminidase [Methylomirabilota bacterium]|nr:beta-N-acetylhexosaminidase [Methylomirabilota bacterium]